VISANRDIHGGNEMRLDDPERVWNLTEPLNEPLNLKAWGGSQITRHNTPKGLMLTMLHDGPIGCNFSTYRREDMGMKNIPWWEPDNDGEVSRFLEEAAPKFPEENFSQEDIEEAIAFSER
jgi:hypothetical protein